MVDNMQSVRDDIAFMRALAQEGRRAPLLGGGILVAAGLIYAAASLVQWAMITQVLRISPWGMPVLWLGATVAFLGVARFLRARLARAPGACSPDNRAARTAWASVGWTIFVIAAIIAIIGWRTHSAVPLLMLAPLILALYALGWSVGAALTGKRWIWAVAVGSYGAALIAALVAPSPSSLLVFAAALVLLTALPGFLLIRQEPSDTV